MFDYDVTLMIFFLNAQEKVYGRYGGRDAKSADGRQSPDGLLHTMKSVLRMHESGQPAFAPRLQDAPRFVRDGFDERGFGRGCTHCHQVKETLHRELQRAGKWSRDLIWRYPPPENLGFELEVARGNVIKEVKPESAAAAVGLRAGDTVRQLHGVPVHSFADAQFALDLAPATGSIALSWQRGDSEPVMEGSLSLPDGWRKTEIAWRPSLRHMLASARLYGRDLTGPEKQALGLSPKQLAFRQGDPVPSQAQTAGIRPGDIILGVDDKTLETDAEGFRDHIRQNYVIGDRVTVNLLRDGKRTNLAMTLVR